MKTIKIALMSTFLMMCFVYTSQAQIFQLPHSITGMSMTPIGNGQVLVEYDIFGPNTSVLTQIKIEGLTLAYSDMVSGGDSVSTIVTVPLKNSTSSREVYISCELRRINGTPIALEGCDVVIGN